MADLAALREKVGLIWPHLAERARRLFAANEARQLGHGGLRAVSLACGLSRMTITKALHELDQPPLAPGRIQRPGAGRSTLVTLDPSLLGRLEGLVDPLSRGDPEAPLRWTVKSTRTLAAELKATGQPISNEKVAQLLRQMDFSLQGNRKIEEGADHPDRDAQFRHIGGAVRRALADGAPGISVDTKKKELIGNYVHGGRQWRNARSPRRESTYDFPDASVPRAYPYGIYDLGRNTGFVSIGTDHDTSAFAVASIRGWWRFEGRRLYRGARELLVTADGGDSNGYRRRQWKFEPQRMADDIGLPIRVFHFPPGTSKWNKVEHRLFSFSLVELARRAPLRLRDDRPLDRCDDNGQGPESHLPSGPPPLPRGAPSDRRGDGNRQPRAGSIPRGMELRHSTRSRSVNVYVIP